MSDYQQNQQGNQGGNNWQNRQNNQQGGGNNWQNRQGGQGGQGGGGGFPKKPFGGGGVRFHNTMMESKLRLSGEKQAGVSYKNDFPPGLQVRLYETNPRVVVKPNIEGEIEEINLRMDPIIAEIFFNTILQACEEKAGWRQAIIFKNRDAETNKIYDEARAVIGRHSDNGVVYLEVSPMTEDSRLKVTFNFASRAFTDFLYSDGTKMTPEDLSTLYAKSWAGRMTRLLDVALMTIPFKKKEWTGGQNNQQGGQKPWQKDQGGQKPWQNNQQNNYQQRPAQQPAPQQEQRPVYGQTAPAAQPAAAPANNYIQSGQDSYDQYDDVPA